MTTDASLSTTFEAILVLTLSITTTLPLAILAFVATLSYSYKLANHFPLSSPNQQLLINFHALTTEGCQLILVLLGAGNAAFVIEKTIDLARRGYITTIQVPFLIEAGLLVVVVLHLVMVFAVDLVEGRIAEGAWRHPYEWRPFILTRSWVFRKEKEMKSSVTSTGQLTRSNTPRDDTSESITELAYHMAKLDYLDLAYSNATTPLSASIDDRSLAWVASSPPKSEYGSEIIERPGEVETEDLPSPPDSGECVKKVKWAPNVTVL